MSAAITLGQSSSPLHPRHLARIVGIAGLAVGVLDALDGVAYFGITAGLNPIQVLQFIASGALGPAAFAGGLAAAALGAVIHFAIAYTAVAIYALVHARFEWARTHWVAGGLAFGLSVWAFMNLVVVPLSAIGQVPTLGAAIHGIIGHALTVGLTSAYVFRCGPRILSLDHG
jgi:hypothetical protein